MSSTVENAAAIATRIWPGLAISAAIAAAAMAARLIPGLQLLSPMILAILLAMAVHHTVGVPAQATPGIKFAMRPILRFGIVLLGFQLTVAQIGDIGWLAFAMIAAAVFVTLAATRLLARAMGVDAGLAELIGTGTAICGASAVIAANTVTRASDADVTYALATVTLFGSVAMFLYPLLAAPLALSPEAYGLWTGSSVHEVAQVVAAAFQLGDVAGQIGTTAKLSRVLLLAPVVLGLGLLAARSAAADGNRRSSVPFPWFIVGFAAIVVLNSSVTLPHDIKQGFAWLTSFLLTTGLAAMGLEIRFGDVRSRGPRPLLLALTAWFIIAGFSYTAIKFL
ncbi:MAG: putative sulfate exporter family transporter [Xanthobacteraceae bacterium]